MKKPGFTAVVLVAVVVSSHAQGTIEINNREPGVFLAPVYGSGGAPLGGTGFTFALFAGPSADNWQFVGQTTFRTGTGAGYTVAGSATVAIPGVAPGESAILQARAWDNRGGTITTWEQARAAQQMGQGQAGCSTIFTSRPLGGTNSEGTIFPIPRLHGLESFSISCLSCVCGLPPRLTSGALNGDDFQFRVVGSGSGTLTIETSRSLAEWEVIGTGHFMGDFTFIHTGATLNVSSRLYRARVGLDTSINTLGFVRRVIPPHNIALLGKQIGTDRASFAELVPDAVPGRTFIYTYQPGFGFNVYAFDDVENSWPPGTIGTHEGFFVRNTSASDVTVVSIGDVPTPSCQGTFPAGFSLLAPFITGDMFPGRAAAPGDVVYKFDAGAQNFVLYTFDDLDLVWTPSEPTFSPGDGFFLYARNPKPCRASP